MYFQSNNVSLISMPFTHTVLILFKQVFYCLNWDLKNLLNKILYRINSEAQTTDPETKFPSLLFSCLPSYPLRSYLHSPKPSLGQFCWGSLEEGLCSQTHTYTVVFFSDFSSWPFRIFTVSFFEVHRLCCGKKSYKDQAVIVEV